MAGIQIHVGRDIANTLKNIRYHGGKAYNAHYKATPKILTPKSVLLNNMSRNPELTYENYLHPFLTGAVGDTSQLTPKRAFSFDHKSIEPQEPTAVKTAMDEVFKRWKLNSKKQDTKSWYKFNVTF